jgi:glycosyltransferase involved in cell wall biosynthesis
MTVFQNEEDLRCFTARGLVAPSRARLIPSSGIDVARFDAATPPPEQAARLRQELRLDGFKVVLCVSRLTRHKGIPTLLAAAAQLAGRRPDVRVVLVGPRETEGPLAVSLAALERHAPYVQVLGPRDDVPALLSLADVFVLPTEYREGVPRVLLEAGLARRPMVATRMPSCTQVVRDGWNGRLVPPRDAAAMARAIEALLLDTDSARAMGACGRDLVEREFSIERVATAYADVYTEALAEGSPNSVLPARWRRAEPGSSIG